MTMVGWVRGARQPTSESRSQLASKSGAWYTSCTTYGYLRIEGLVGIGNPPHQSPAPDPQPLLRGA
jgi:hypothetical protein